MIKGQTIRRQFLNVRSLRSPLEEVVEVVDRIVFGEDSDDIRACLL